MLYRAWKRALRRCFRAEQGAIRTQKDLEGYEPICEHCSAGDRIVLPALHSSDFCCSDRIPEKNSFKVAGISFLHGFSGSSSIALGFVSFRPMVRQMSR